MFKRTSAARELITCVTIMLTVAACGGSDGATGVEKPPVIPPTLVAGTSEPFDAALNAVLDVFPSVVVKDQNGNGVGNVWIKWTASSGKVEKDSSLSDASGRANAGRWTLSTVSGKQTVTARAGDVSVVAMTANIAPGPMVGLVAASTALTGVAGGDLASPASIKAVDAFGNGVPRVFVQFAMWAGGGTITGAGQTTNDDGIATVGSWKLGPKSGTQSIRADDHRTGATTLVHATAVAAPATEFVVIDGNAQTGQANKRLCTSPVIAVRDAFGNGVGQIPIVFTPGAGSGTVTDGSVMSSAGTGYATVGAWTLSTNATQTLVVSSPSLPGISLTLTATAAPSTAYTVCARYLGSGGTPRQRQAVATAIERWQRVITAHVQTTQLTETANRCFAGAPGINEMVEDLLVFVQITPIDGPGSIVSRAGPCTVHAPSLLTQMGLLQLDSADLELLLGQGTLDNMVTHEFGHVLGFGTLWTTRNLLSGAGTSDPTFTGAGARAQFAQLFPSYAGSTVPVENVGEIGTRDAHWRRNVFNNELMQGTSSANMPMSSVTVASLGDLGYAVDLTKADPFTFIGAVQALSSATATQPDEYVTEDIADTDIWGVEKNGRRFLVRAARNPLLRK